MDDWLCSQRNSSKSLFAVSMENSRSANLMLTLLIHHFCEVQGLISSILKLSQKFYLQETPAFIYLHDFMPVFIWKWSKFQEKLPSSKYKTAWYGEKLSNLVKEFWIDFLVLLEITFWKWNRLSIRDKIFRDVEATVFDTQRMNCPV